MPTEIDDAALAFLVARAGLRILELPVPHGRRRAGKSKVAGTLRGTVKAGFRILATFARVACERR